MPIYRPDYSPRLNPYGSLTDITPEDLEDLFEASRTANPAYTSYRLKTVDVYRLFAYVGETTFPKNLYLFRTDDGGEEWERFDWAFPPDHIMEDAIVEAKVFYSDTLYMATRTFTPGGDHLSIDTWVSDDLGETWEFAWSLTDEVDFDFINHRIFPTSAGVYQVACTIKDASPDVSKTVGYLDGVKILDQPTPSIISIGGVNVSYFTQKYETGFFAVQFNTFLGGSEIWKVTTQGFELRGTVPASVFTIPPTNLRPQISQIWYLRNKGVLYLPTLLTEGARIYTSFDEGQTFLEEDGGIFISIPAITTIGRRSIFSQPQANPAPRFRNEAYLQDVSQSTSWGDILDAYSDDEDWDLGLERRLFRRGSRFYLWKFPE
ncbi:MAG: hypothetical protein ACREOP_02185 [Thermodesulfobacteriota bacterium]